MIKVLFFAQIRELLETASLDIETAPITVQELRNELSLNGDKWHYALQEKTVLCAVNKQLVDDLYLIQNDDEVAFFPPVTGG